MSRLDEILFALLEDGVPAPRAEKIVDRYRELTKKKKRRKIEPINRDRMVVKAARADLAKQLEHLFKRERPKVAAQISQLINRTAKSDDDRVEMILGELDFDGWVTIVVDGEKILVHVTVDGSGEAIAQIGKKLTPILTDQVNEAAVEWARERAAEMVGMRINVDGELVPNPNAEWAITDSTRELLRGDVASAIEEGLSPADLADRLAASYAFSDDRAMTIARTEIANADVQGSLIAYRESGVVSGKELVLSDAHDDPDECDDAAAMGVVPIDDDFGGLGDPPYHPKCECDVLPVLAEEDETDA
jgi:hypothetical protein